MTMYSTTIYIVPVATWGDIGRFRSQAEGLNSLPVESFVFLEGELGDPGGLRS